MDVRQKLKPVDSDTNKTLTSLISMCLGPTFAAVAVSELSTSSANANAKIKILNQKRYKIGLSR